jgi:hypothetical protein
VTSYILERSAATKRLKRKLASLVAGNGESMQGEDIEGCIENAALNLLMIGKYFEEESKL